MSGKSLVDTITVKNECHEDWNSMTGNDTVRFCGHCAKNVNNLSAMTRKEAMRLVRASDGKLCVRFAVDPSTGAPAFAPRLHRISRRATIAAGVLGASLTLSGLALGQPARTTMQRRNDPRIEVPAKNEDPKPTGRLAVTLRDADYKVAPDIIVRIVSADGKTIAAARSNADGEVTFNDLAPGDYRIESDAEDFEPMSVTVVNSETATVVVELARSSNKPLRLMGDVAFVGYSNELFKAISRNDMKQLSALLAGGADVNAKDSEYSEITPLFIAVEEGNVAAAELLLEFGAKVNARDDNNQTPLMRIDEDASPELLDLLFKYGANADLEDRAGNNALISAARSADPEILKILIRQTTRIDARNSKGRTALMEAADADLIANVRVLIEAGADLNLRDDYGDSAWDLTTDDEIEQLLESNGAKTESN